MHYQLKITLKDVAPPVWRRVVVSSELTLLDLHHVIQIVMGWEDYHLHDFTIAKRRYALPDPEDFDEPADESRVRLRDVARLRGRLLYQYDFGDDWEHTVVVEKIIEEPVADDAICTDGKRACPPEDSGGPWGYQEKLQALANPRDKYARELRDWMPRGFDSEAFDRDAVNEKLRRVFESTRAKKPRRPRKSGH